MARTERSSIRIWREQHLWCFRASLQRLLARPAGTLMTVVVMGFALALPLMFWLLLGNVQHLAGSLGETQTLNVFLTVDADAEQAAKLADEWRAREEIAGVKIIDPQSGLRELAKLQGFEDALEGLEHNPLPYALLVEPAADLDAEAVSELTTQLAADAAVDQVQDDRLWRTRLEALVLLGWRVVVVISVLLALAAVLVVGNSVRLDIQNRARELGILKLVGASHAFVRRPYLYAGTWYGLVGGALASLLVMAVERVLRAPIEQLMASYGGRLVLDGLAWWQFLSVPLLAALLGWLGARLVSGHWLRQSQ